MFQIGDLVSMINGNGEIAYITKIINQDVYVVWLQWPHWGERRTNWTMLKKINH